jgi:hypothetical protein
VSQHVIRLKSLTVRPTSSGWRATCSARAGAIAPTSSSPTGLKLGMSKPSSFACRAERLTTRNPTHCSALGDPQTLKRHSCQSWRGGPVVRFWCFRLFLLLRDLPMPVHFGHDLGSGDIVLAAKRADNFGIDGGIAAQGGKKPPPGLSIGLVRGHCHVAVTHLKTSASEPPRAARGRQRLDSEVGLQAYNHIAAALHAVFVSGEWHCLTSASTRAGARPSLRLLSVGFTHALPC